ncbi:MAG: hypothetical protein U5N58_07790 [Actinomycetota bacterium]|nr:hypothetical protein [Actinomycetota bacterium]
MEFIALATASGGDVAGIILGASTLLHGDMFQVFSPIRGLLKVRA